MLNVKLFLTANRYAERNKNLQAKAISCDTWPLWKGQNLYLIGYMVGNKIEWGLLR